MRWFRSRHEGKRYLLSLPSVSSDRRWPGAGVALRREVAAAACEGARSIRISSTELRSSSSGFRCAGVYRAESSWRDSSPDVPSVIHRLLASWRSVVPSGARGARRRLRQGRHRARRLRRLKAEGGSNRTAVHRASDAAGPNGLVASAATVIILRSTSALGHEWQAS